MTGAAATLAALATPPALAQPVATEDDGLRVRMGFQSLPLPEDAQARRRFEQRTTAVISYRVAITDVGVGLPTPRFAPDVSLANPTLFTISHFAHRPVWLALRLTFEPPLLHDSGWLLRAHLGSNLFLGERVEFFNMVGPNLALARPEGAFITWESALVARVVARLSIGPEATLRFDPRAFEDVALGGRLRWELRRQERTAAVVLVSATTPARAPDPAQMNVMSWVQFFWQPW